jgi:hypothetical protein
MLKLPPSGRDASVWTRRIQLLIVHVGKNYRAVLDLLFGKGPGIDFFHGIFDRE